MKNAIGLIFAGLLVFIMPAAQAAQKSAGALRNLDWAGATVDKIEKDLAEFIQVNKLPTSNALAAAIQKARAKLSDLKSIVTVIEPGPEDLGKVMNYTKNLSNLAQTIMDRISDLDGKREAYRKLIADNPPLAKTDFGKRFDDEFRLLGESLVRLTACQLESKPIEAGEAEGAWNLQALRCDQMMEEGSEEAAYLARKEELKNSMRANRSGPSNAASRNWQRKSKNRPTISTC
ncbi:MAG: hypothetical protein NTX50_08485 [Candidatus Sumerlaeota bacterium]|nr:hypothetical protein [Candidatus Sumerlaeota bacterium]